MAQAICQAERPLLDSIEHRFEVYRTLTDADQRKAYYHQIDSISQLAARYNIPNEYDKMMSAIGADGSNAYTSNDVTCYEEDIPSNEVDNWARIQGDRFQNMVIRGFHTELEAVYEEFNINMASDGYKTYTALLKKLFPTHPYGTQTTIGLQEHLKNPSITNIKKYFAKYYVPNNVAICMARRPGLRQDSGYFTKILWLLERLRKGFRARISATARANNATRHERGGTEQRGTDDGLALRTWQCTANGYA